MIKALAGALNDQDGLPRMHASSGLLRFVQELLLRRFRFRRKAAANLG